MAKEVMEHKVEQGILGFLSGHVVKLPLNIYVYTLALVLFSTLERSPFWT